MYSKWLHIHYMYTVNCCTCTVCIQYTVAHCQWLSNHSSTQASAVASSDFIWKTDEVMFQCVIIDFALLILIFRIKHVDSLETGVMTSQMISHFQMGWWQALGQPLTILRVFTGILQCIVSTPKHSCCLLKDKDNVYICFQTVPQSYLYDHKFTLMDYILPAQDIMLVWDGAKVTMT